MHKKQGKKTKQTLGSTDQLFLNAPKEHPRSSMVNSKKWINQGFCFRYDFPWLKEMAISVYGLKF